MEISRFIEALAQKLECTPDKSIYVTIDAKSAEKMIAEYAAIMSALEQAQQDEPEPAGPARKKSRKELKKLGRI